MNDKDIKDTLNKAKDKLPDPQEVIRSAKEALPNITPKPPGLQSQSSPQDLKARLEWGEPALTIVDIRDRDAFNNAHIMGAVPIPMDQITELAESTLQKSRDIYVYGATDQETATAAAQLRKAGFEQVAEIKGGLAAWKAIAGSTEGIEEAQTPPEGQVGYNVVSTVQHDLEKKRGNP